MNLSKHSTVATKTKRTMRNMSSQTKLEAIRRVHAGESKAYVARSIGVPESTLRGWCKNEEKILYISRQSIVENDESLEQLQPKKIKLEEQERMQPFDFSFTINGSRSSSPDVALDYSRSSPTSPNRPLNMTARMETSDKATQASDTEKGGIVLGRRLELGLNRPELLPTPSNVSAHQTDVSASVMDQWRAMMIQQQLSVATAPVDTSNMARSSGGLLAIADQEETKYSSRGGQSVQNWHKYQHMNQPQEQLATHPAVKGAASPSPTVNRIRPTQSSLIWKWYEQAFTQHVQQISAQDPKTFHQHLMKDEQQNVSPSPQPPAGDHYEENSVDSKNTFHRLGNHKGKTLLDSLLFNSDNVKEEPLDARLTRDEAVQHGERFLEWLEAYSNPSITTVHVLQFRDLLNKLKGA